MSLPLRFLCIGDPHFKVNNVQETAEATRKILAKVQELKPDIVVVMGDILDRHESIHVTPLKSAIAFLKDLSDLVTTYVLIGNHDRPNNSTYLTDDHPFTALKEWKNCIIVDKVVVATIADQKFTFVPYVPPGRFVEALASYSSSSSEEKMENLPAVTNVRAIFCHQELFGCKMGTIASATGDHWSSTAPLIISGHIHDYQEINNNIIYVGSMLQQAFGEDESKSISLLTFEEHRWDHRRLDLDLIKKRIVRLKCSEVSTYTPPPNCLIKLVIEGTWDETKSISKIAKIKELTKSGVKISYHHTSSEDNEDKKEEENETPTPKGEEGSSMKKIRYLGRLHQEIQGQPRQLIWLERLFGSVDDRRLF